MITRTNIPTDGSCCTGPAAAKNHRYVPDSEAPDGWTLVCTAGWAIPAGIPSGLEVRFDGSVPRGRVYLVAGTGEIPPEKSVI